MDNNTVIVLVVAIIAAYKLIERWIDSRDADDTRETDTYTSTERHDRDTSQYDGGYHERPDIQLGFQREQS